MRMKDQRRRPRRRRRQIVEQCRPLVEQIQRLTDEVEYLLDQATVEKPRGRTTQSRPSRPSRPKQQAAARKRVATGRILDMSPQNTGPRGSWSIAISYKGKTPKIALSGRLTELFYHLAAAPADEQSQPSFQTAEQIRSAMRAKDEQAVVKLVHRLRKTMDEQGLPKRLIETRKDGGPRYRIWLAGGLPDDLPAVAQSPQIQQWSQMAGR